MASISNSPPPPLPPLLIHKNPTSTSSSSSSLHFSSPSILSFPSYRTPLVPRLRPLIRTGFDGGRVACQDAQSPDLRNKPVVSSSSSSSSNEENRLRRDKGSSSDGEEEWVDWEDMILEDTVPLVGFVRMLLHSGKYQTDERLSPDHEKTILERLLPYHPDYEKKIGSGIDHIKIGYHPDFDSRCLFIVKNDGKSIDFSYWKCIKGLVKKKYPLYADTFILRHFRQQRNLID